ncbi:hypothetical protein T484DRAFT_1767384, partial [Baffinella frigidus]
AWSNLPKGSGLGTSSILSAAVLAAATRAAALTYSAEALVHGVLSVEQSMAVGGGWQDQTGGLFPADQAGGLFPAFKAISSPKGPLVNARVTGHADAEANCPR